jgi:hypothetical protein
MIFFSGMTALLGSRLKVDDVLRMESPASGFANAMIPSEHDDFVRRVEELVYLNCQAWKLEPDSSENSFDHLVHAWVRAAIRQQRILGCAPLDRWVERLKNRWNVSRCEGSADLVDDIHV